MLSQSAHRRQLRAACLVIFLLVMSFGSPVGAMATQPDAATPISAEPVMPGASISTSDDGDVSAAATNQASFDQLYYTVDATGSLPAALIIQMGGVVAEGSFTINLFSIMPGITLALQSATPMTSGVTCEAVIDIAGTITGSFTNTEIGPGRCVVDFTIVTSGLLAFPPPLTGTVVMDGEMHNPNNAGFFLNAVPAPVRRAFDAPVYPAVAGEPFDIGVTIIMDGFAPYDISAVVSLPGIVAFDGDSVTAISSDPNTATCSANYDQLTQMVNIMYSNTSMSTATCSVTMSATVYSLTGDGVQIPVNLTTPSAQNLPPVQAMIVGYLQSTGELTLSLDRDTAFAQDVVEVTISQSQNLVVVGENRMQVLFPAGVTGVPDSGEVTCLPVACPAVTINVGPTSALVTYVSVLAGTTATWTFNVEIDDDVAVPAMLAFSANGEVGTGFAAQRTGPATASLTVIEALATGDQDFSVDYRGSVSGSIAATGGTPNYTFAVQDAPSLGDIELDPGTGAFTYTANDLATGNDIFTVLVTDSTSPTPRTVLATVNVTIGDPAPLSAAPLTLTADPGETITGNLASQISGGMPPYTFTVLSQPALGSVTIAPDGSFTFEAHADASGTDSYTYTVTDSEPQATGLNAVASVTGEVTIDFAAIPATATATATQPDASTPPATATATSVDGLTPPAGVTATATTDPGNPPARPTQTATPASDSAGGGPGSGEGTNDGTGTGVTALPSTGAGSGHTGPMLLLLLTGALLLLAGSIGFSRRR